MQGKRVLPMTLILPLIVVAVASGLDFAQWLAQRGGAVETDAGSRITAVKLGFRWVSDADVEALAALKDLRKLDLSFSLITDAGMERLKPLNKVTDLNLFAVEKITDVGLSYIRDWKKLERLNLHGTDVTDI